MKEIVLANQVLNEIIFEGVSFKKALKNVFAENYKDRKQASIVSIFVGCALRHNLLFKKVLENVKLDEKDPDENLLFLALANKFFLHRLDENQLHDFVKKQLGDKYTPEIEKILKYDGKINELVNVEKDSFESVSIRFNTPVWLVKMWKNHFGTRNSFKLLKTNISADKTYLRYNPCFVRPVELDDASLFKQSEVENVYEYIGKESYKRLEGYQKNALFVLKPVIKELFDKYINPLSEQISLYANEDAYLIKELHAQSNNKQGINVVVSKLDEHVESQRYIRVNKITNINLFEANEIYGYKVGITSPQDLVIVNPTSSSFNKIRSLPDYLLHFDPQNLDKYIAKQKEVLKDLSTFVNDGGILIYMVDTLNKKESLSVVSSFLLNNPEFELIDERQIFPFEDEDVALYYAVMKKEIQK